MTDTEPSTPTVDTDELRGLLRRALDRSGMTQAQLAERLGIHPGEVSRRINNPADLRWSTLTRTLAAMGARVEMVAPTAAPEQCSHESADGVDDADLTDPAKRWRCNSCGEVYINDCPPLARPVPAAPAEPGRVTDARKRLMAAVRGPIEDVLRTQAKWLTTPPDPQWQSATLSPRGPHWLTMAGWMNEAADEIDRLRAALAAPPAPADEGLPKVIACGECGETLDVAEDLIPRLARYIDRHRAAAPPAAAVPEERDEGAWNQRHGYVVDQDQDEHGWWIYCAAWPPCDLTIPGPYGTRSEATDAWADAHALAARPAPVTAAPTEEEAP